MTGDGGDAYDKKEPERIICGPFGMFLELDWNSYLSLFNNTNNQLKLDENVSN